MAAVQLDFAEHGAAPRTRLRQRSILVSRCKRFLKHLGGFVEIAAHLRYVREASEGGEAWRDPLQLAVIHRRSVEVASFEGAVAGKGEEALVLRILGEALLSGLAGFAEVMAREQEVGARLQHARIARENGFGLVEHLPAAVVVGTVAG